MGIILPFLHHFEPKTPFGRMKKSGPFSFYQLLSRLYALQNNVFQDTAKIFKSHLTAMFLTEPLRLSVRFIHDLLINPNKPIPPRQQNTTPIPLQLAQ